MSGYDQKCPACGTVHHIKSLDAKLDRCPQCSKIQIARVMPVEHRDEDVEPTRSASTIETQSEYTAQSANPVSHTVSSGQQPKVSPQNNTFDKNADIFGSILGGMNKKVSLLYNGMEVVQLDADTMTDRYMLGRAANLSQILCKDMRVGNFHCYLLYKDNSWYVYDNNSTNGTSVNGEVIGSKLTNGGERRLNNGDLLRLGHSVDCITFIIKLEM